MYVMRQMLLSRHPEPPKPHLYLGCKVRARFLEMLKKEKRATFIIIVPRDSLIVFFLFDCSL